MKIGNCLACGAEIELPLRGRRFYCDPRCWHAANREKRRRQKAAEHRRNRARYAARERIYSVIHAEKKRAATRAWAQAHPERRRQRRRIDEAARRARKRGQFVEKVDPAVVFERSAGRCGICSGAVDRETFHVDHIIPLARGGEHSYANVQAAHPWCNLRKGVRVGL